MNKSNMPKPGQIVGKYLLRKRLHTGGMASVFAASDVNSGESFAVKFLHSELMLDVELVMRFVNEAHVLYSLAHPALPRLYDGSLLPEGMYMTLELLGPSLAERLDGAGRRPSMSELLLVGRHVAAGLVALHAQGCGRVAAVRATGSGGLQVGDRRACSYSCRISLPCTGYCGLIAGRSSCP